MSALHSPPRLTRFVSLLQRMDCHLHGICQARLYPVANQMSMPAPPSTGLEVSQPCSPTCYLHANRAAAGGDERLAHGVAQLQLSSSERQARRGEAGKDQQDEEKKAAGADGDEGAVERGVAGQEAGRQAGGRGSEQAGQSGGVDEGGGGQGAREAGGVSSSRDAQSMMAQGRAREGGAKEVRGLENQGT